MISYKKRNLGGKSTIYWILILFVSVLILLQACKGKCGNSKNSSESIESTDFSVGEMVYKSKCSVCHQADGKGIPGAFPGLAGKKTDLKTVYNGREGTIMKAFKQELTDIEIIHVVNYVNHSWGNQFPILPGDSLKVLR
jgi:mono/diheme cytochrome c family protein